MFVGKKVPSNPYFTRVVSIIKFWIIQQSNVDVKLKTPNIYYLDFFKSKYLELQILSWNNIAVLILQSVNKCSVNSVTV